MICFYPNGTIQTKINICSYTACLEGNFIDCSEKGKVILGDKDDDDYDTDSDVEFEDEDAFGDDVEADMEKFELRSENVLQLVKNGSVIALFSPPNALEIFYLCQVIESGVAKQHLSDSNNHHIEEGSPYLLVNYYEKKPNSEFSKNRHVIYRLVSNPVYVIPSQVMSPSVNVSYIGTDVHLSLDEYQWMTDSIGSF